MVLGLVALSYVFGSKKSVDRRKGPERETGWYLFEQALCFLLQCIASMQDLRLVEHRGLDFGKRHCAQAVGVESARCSARSKPCKPKRRCQSHPVHQTVRSMRRHPGAENRAALRRATPFEQRFTV